MERKRGVRRPDRHHFGLRPHRASNFIRSLDAIEPGDEVIIVCRVTTPQQRANGNLRDQIAYLRRIAAAHGATVVRVVWHVGPGHEREWHAKLAKVAVDARQSGAKLLAESTSRLIRPLRFHPYELPHAKADSLELAKLEFYTSGVTLVTVLHPDAPWKVERSYQINRGRGMKEAKGGRPKARVPRSTKARRERLLPKAVAMKADGVPQREIARRLKTPEATVRRWLR